MSSQPVAQDILEVQKIVRTVWGTEEVTLAGPDVQYTRVLKGDDVGKFKLGYRYPVAVLRWVDVPGSLYESLELSSSSIASRDQT